MFRRSVRRYEERPLFGLHDEASGTWRWRTYREVGVEVEAYRSALEALGVGRGDRIAVISNNRIEWAIACYAAYGRGAAWVPMYEAQLESDWSFILEDSGAKLCFTSTEAIAERIRAIAPNLRVVSFEGELPRLVAEARERPSPPITPSPDDVANIIYTSGTTGKPKGVVLSHANLVASIAGAGAVFPFSPDDRSLAFLPWAHVAGGVSEIHGIVASGASTAICSRVDRILPSLAEVQPTVLIAVPRIWNKLYDGVQKQLAARPKAIRDIVKLALAAATKEREGKPLKPHERAALAFAKKVVFSKITARLGGRLRCALSGAAALSPDVARFIDGLGIRVYEAYGMTESSSACTVNRRDAQRIGSVGLPFPGVRIELDHDVLGGDKDNGEIIIHSPGVMVGYLNRPDDTAATLTKDRGLRTGDLGRIDGDGFLFITGRVKELYKLENGKFVAPAPMEETITLSPFIAQVMVHGLNRPYNVALVVPDRASLEAWAKENAISAADYATLCRHPRVHALITGEISRLLSQGKGYEKVERFVVVPDEMTVEGGALTPTMKLKRKVVTDRFRSQLDSLYAPN